MELIRSPQWNWGSARGTGHDCAAICRQQYSTKESREELIQNLLEPHPDDPKSRIPLNFEEVTLVLGLAWQNGRWDGSDGGKGGYGEVLQHMAGAKRYEVGSEEECRKRFVEDLQDRFELLDSIDVVSSELREMRCILDDDSDLDYARRKASGLVLEAMGFVDKGC